MDFTYSSFGNIVINFSSDTSTTIKLTVNGTVSQLNCNGSANFGADLDLMNHNTIMIENLTSDAACNIDGLQLDRMDLSPILYELTNTYSKESNERIGRFVRDIFTPDIAIINFPNNLYQTIYPHFKSGNIKLVPPV